jgi:hypothetical protein
VDKTPVLLVVLVETARLRWFVAMIGLDGRTTPLLCSEPGDLEKYHGLTFEDQVAFLRHRFCGVLQRGCDRVWARDARPCQFVFVFEGELPEPTGTLTRTFAEHQVLWMIKPPLVVFNRPDAAGPLERLAGEMDGQHEQTLLAHLGELLAARENPEAWELSRKKPG